MAVIREPGTESPDEPGDSVTCSADHGIVTPVMVTGVCNV